MGSPRPSAVAPDSIEHDTPVLDYETNLAHCGHAGRWISFDCDEIREFAGFDRSKLIRSLDHGGGIPGSGGDCLHRSESEFDEQCQLCVSRHSGSSITKPAKRTWTSISPGSIVRPLRSMLLALLGQSA